MNRPSLLIPWVLPHCDLPTVVRLAHLDKRRRTYVQRWFRRRAVKCLARILSSREEADAMLRLTGETRGAVVGSVALAVLTISVMIRVFQLPQNVNILIPRRYLRDWCIFLGTRGYQP